MIDKVTELAQRFMFWYTDFCETNWVFIGIFFVLLIALARTKVEMHWWDFKSLGIVVVLYFVFKGIIIFWLNG